MKKRVLVIEDNPWNARLIREILGEDEYDIVDAPDGEAGIEEASQNTPDIVLLDLMLPRMSGEEVARKLRDIEALQNIPIIVVTANASTDLRQRVMEAGANDYINKPFTKRMLQEMIRRNLGV